MKACGLNARISELLNELPAANLIGVVRSMKTALKEIKMANV